MTVLAIIEIQRGDQVYKPVVRAMSTTGGESSENSGNSYVAITRNNLLYTLMLITENQANKETLTRKAIYHAKKTKGEIITNEDVAVHFKPNVALKIMADVILRNKPEEPVGKVTDPSQLRYKVRGDYRNSQPDQPSTFDHKDYGKGKIIASDPGMKSTGVWDSITVQFPGQPAPKIFKKLYTTSYFRQFVKAESYVRLLEKLTNRKIVLV